MAVLKCKMCGGDIQTTDNAYGTCESCGSTMTLPKASDDRKANLFNRANHFRRQNDFDKAVQAYENILNEDSTDAEAHWGIVLSRYGIEYVEDPATSQRVPTCHRVQEDSILSDPDYQAALKYASDEYTKSLYGEEAKRISEIQTGILAISRQEAPYDVFICYKETTDGGSRTKDGVIAQDIYYELTKDGYRVFFSRITLEDKLGQQYEPYIFSALNSAKVMLVIGTCKEYFEAVWVKNEWSRFLAITKKDRSRLLIPCYRDMNAYDLPDELSALQSQDISKIGFMQDIQRGVKKVLEASKTAEIKTSQQDKQVENLVSKIEENLQTPDISIFEAIRAGDVQAVRQWLKAVPNLLTTNNESTEYLPLLHFAAKYCPTPDAIESIVKAGTNVQEKDKGGNAPIHLAANFNNTDVLNFLVKSGANVNDTDNEGNTPLHLATATNEKHSLESLVKMGATVNVNNNAGNTPLHIAAEKNDKEKIELLVKVGANISAINKNGSTLLHDAFRAKRKEEVGYFLSLGANINEKDKAGNTLLHCSDVVDSEDVEYLLELGANVNEKNEKGDTPLQWAVAKGNIEMTEFFARAGANVNEKNEKGNTPLQWAVVKGNIEMTEFLARAGANINEKDEDGNTLLQYAVIKRNKEMLEYLLALGVNVNEKNKENKTPLANLLAMNAIQRNVGCFFGGLLFGGWLASFVLMFALLFECEPDLAAFAFGVALLAAVPFFSIIIRFINVYPKDKEMAVILFRAGSKPSGFLQRFDCWIYTTFQEMGLYVPPYLLISLFPQNKKLKNKKLVAGLLGIFLGGVGAHKFYMGSWGWGWVYFILFTTYVGAIGITIPVSIFEGIRFLMMSEETFAKKYPPETRYPFRW